MIAAAGGTGKTTTLVHMSVSVALGLSWCGFQVENRGPVALCLGESDDALMRRHLWRAYNALDLSPEQRAEAVKQILPMPLSGHEVNFIRGIGTDLERTEFYTRLRKRLEKLASQEGFQWSMIVLDPLSRFAGPDTEKDSAAATRFVQALEVLTKLPGTPAVMCAHHSSKNSMQLGKNDARGSTALRDGVRSVMTLTRHKAEGVVGVMMSCDKSNEAPHFEDRWLVQQQGDKGGTLRMSTESEAAMLTESIKPKRRGRPPADVMPPIEDLKSRLDPKSVIVAKLTELGGSARSRTWLEPQLSGCRHDALRAAFRDLEAEGVIRIIAKGKWRGRVELMEFAAQTEIEPGGPVGDDAGEGGAE
jgi:hypothetical protein